MSRNNRQSNTLFIIIGSITFLVIVVALTLYIWKFYSNGLSNEPSDWASFGAYVGGILGTCFAFATFWMLFSTFLLQQKQSENIEVQKFETTFYSLLELHNQKLRELDLDPVKLAKLFDNDPRIGQALAMSDDDFKKVSDYSAFQSKEGKYETTTAYLKELQREILEDIQLSQYFRVLYQLLKYITRNNIKNLDHNFDTKYLSNQSNLSIEYEKIYSSIVRGFVPVPLLPILALNCIYTPEGLKNLDKYQALLERYNFLEHIRFDLLPKNLATFVILNNYNFALGDNSQAKHIGTCVLEKYDSFSVNKNSYLHKILHEKNQKEEAPESITFKQRLELHFRMIEDGFYKDKSTVHEPIMFLASNTATVVFYLTIFSYIYQRYNDIFNRYSFIYEYLTALTLCITFLLAIYVLTIMSGKLAYSLGKRLQYSDRSYDDKVLKHIAILIITSVTLAMFTIIFIGIFMSANP